MSQRGDGRRCRCHGDGVYAGLQECPRCHHWSYDRYALSCERHQCGYEGPPL